jgi:hypothetical protein
MKQRNYVISVEADGFVRVLEVEKDYIGGKVAYCHEPSANSAISSLWLNPKFYGALDALLVTRQKLEAAPPIIPDRSETQEVMATMKEALLPE